MSDNQKEAWQQALVEEWMIEMNTLSPQLLNKIRLALLVVYPIKYLEVICDPSKFTMQYNCKFYFWKSLFRKKSLLKQIHFKLIDKFQNYQITVTLV